MPLSACVTTPVRWSEPPRFYATGRLSLSSPSPGIHQRNHPARESSNRENTMPRHLKRGMDANAIKAADAKVRETVEQILAEIDARKDAAVRELSQKFDDWSPASFKLAPDEIERAIGQMR